MSAPWDAHPASHAFDLSAPPLGEGAEAWVFALPDDRALRLPKPGSDAGVAARTALLDRLAPGARAAGVPIPKVLDIGKTEGRPWVIERRLPGVPMTEALGQRTDRATLIRRYMEMAQRVGDILTGEDHAEIGYAPPLSDPDGPTFLRSLAARSLQWAGLALDPPDPGLEDGPVGLVHIDYFPGNVMAEGGEITGVIDFGFGTLLSDRRLTPAVAALSLRFRTTATEDDLALAESLTGPVDLPAVRRWLAAFWSFAAKDDTELADWALPELGISKADT